MDDEKDNTEETFDLILEELRKKYRKHLPLEWWKTDRESIGNEKQGELGSFQRFFKYISKDPEMFAEFCKHYGNGSTSPDLLKFAFQSDDVSTPYQSTLDAARAFSPYEKCFPDATTPKIQGVIKKR